MPDFFADTTVEAVEPGSYRATLSNAWDVWGPMGGYVSALALSAMAAESELPRPATFTSQFLSVARFEPVDLRVTRLRRTRRAEALRVDVVQQRKPVLAATAWFVDAGLEGYEYTQATPPEIPGPEALKGYQDLAEDYDGWYPFWRNVEGRPLRWTRDAAPGPAEYGCWIRLLEHGRAPDALACARRQVLFIDLPPWNALIAGLDWPVRHLAPNLDLTVQFHQFAPEANWLLTEGTAPHGQDGLVGSTSRVWTEDGRLLSTSTAQLIMRENPMYAELLADKRRTAAKGGT